ncbi:Aminotransferase class V domain [Trinorchestia longiramus]|nr:Aminotransferase class V domain [Trinorchestia longiramus]
MEFPFSYFSGGPSKIPNEVLEQVSRDVVSYGSTGVGVLEISHRSPAFADILQRAKASASDLLKIPANYRILFMPGGGSGQFSAVALNLMGRTGTADYIVTGCTYIAVILLGLLNLLHFGRVIIISALPPGTWSKSLDCHQARAPSLLTATRHVVQERSSRGSEVWHSAPCYAGRCAIRSCARSCVLEL